MTSDDDTTRTYVPLTSGTEVGHYQIVNKIGAGGMGEVYLAVDSKLNRKVARVPCRPAVGSDRWVLSLDFIATPFWRRSKRMSGVHVAPLAAPDLLQLITYR